MCLAQPSSPRAGGAAPLALDCGDLGLREVPESALGLQVLGDRPSPSELPRESVPARLDLVQREDIRIRRETADRDRLLRRVTPSRRAGRERMEEARSADLT